MIIDKQFLTKGTIEGLFMDTRWSMLYYIRFGKFVGLKAPKTKLPRLRNKNWDISANVGYFKLSPRLFLFLKENMNHIFWYILAPNAHQIMYNSFTTSHREFKDFFIYK